MRRTFAKLAKKGNAALKDISIALGHASLQTTQRYLGLELNLDSGAPDHVDLHCANATGQGENRVKNLLTATENSG